MNSFFAQQNEKQTGSESLPAMTTKGRYKPMVKMKTPPFLNAFNTLIIALLRAGVKIGNMTLLIVRGRKSGQLRTTPVWLSEYNGQRWLVCPYGQAQWVRNLRAAGDATLTRGRRTERVYAVELSPKEAAPLLKRSIAETPSFLLKYYDVKSDAPLEDFERDVLNHPIFLMNSASEGDSRH